MDSCGHKNSNEKAGNKLLKQLSKLNRPLEIQFKEMLTLMNQCDIVERQNQKRIINRSTHKLNDETPKAFQFKNNPFSVFSGIIPGTKWCGTGDIATTYRDLGKLFRSKGISHKVQYNTYIGEMSHQYQFRRFLSSIYLYVLFGSREPGAERVKIDSRMREKLLFER